MNSSVIKKYVCGIMLILAIPVSAMTLSQAMTNLSSAKTQGLVGEQPDGYLGAVTNSSDATEIVKLINEARRGQYEALAKENNLAIADVEAMAGQKAIEKTQPGQYIQINRKWVKKP